MCVPQKDRKHHSSSSFAIGYIYNIPFLIILIQLNINGYDDGNLNGFLLIYLFL